MEAPIPFPVRVSVTAIMAHLSRFFIDIYLSPDAWGAHVQVKYHFVS